MITYGGQLIAKNGTLNIPANIAVINATINSKTTSQNSYNIMVVMVGGQQLDLEGTSNIDCSIQEYQSG